MVSSLKLPANSHKMNKLRNVYTIGREAKNIHQEMSN